MNKQDVMILIMVFGITIIILSIKPLIQRYTFMFLVGGIILFLSREWIAKKITNLKVFRKNGAVE